MNLSNEFPLKHRDEINPQQVISINLMKHSFQLVRQG